MARTKTLKPIARGIRRIIGGNVRLTRIYDVTRELVFGKELPLLDHITRPLNLYRSAFDRPRINLMLYSVEPRGLFGGTMTALAFFEAFRPHFENCRIITGLAPSKAGLERFPGFRYVAPGETSDEPLQITTVDDLTGRTLGVGPGDVFIATHWSTAYRAQRQILPFQAGESGGETRPLVYLIQDYEPGFFGWSSEYLLARSTYESGVPVLAVFNTQLLNDYVKQQGHRFRRAFCFEPKLNAALRPALAPDTPRPPKERQMLVYGRPWDARNAFGLLEAGLRAWASRHPGARDWTVLSAGASHPEIDLGGPVLRSVGKLSLRQYADTLLRSSVGVSLMVSPHPSYPPLEMAHFGLRVVTNAFANKDISTWHDNIRSLGDCAPDPLADAISAACAEVEADPSVGWAARSHVPGYLADTPLFPFIDEIVDAL